MRDFQQPRRSMAYGTRGMCATSHPEATLAALEVMRAGGNAVDAAITASAVQCVVEPAMTGIGGDCFAILWHPKDGLVGLNGCGRSPSRLDADALLDSGDERLGLDSPHAVTIPGAIDAWSLLLERYGRFGLDRALAPAIRLAEEGFVVTPRVAFDWAEDIPRLGRHKGSARHLIVNGTVPAEGEVMRFPALGRSLRLIAEGGRDAFYTGEIAEDMVAELRALGSYHHLDDFAGHRGEWVSPITAPYAGLDVAEIPPNGQGVTALVILNILKQLRSSRGAEAIGAQRFHLLLEAARAAYAVRDTFIADPRYHPVPVDHLLSDELARTLAARIDPKRRTDDLGPVPRPRKSDTIYLSVVDESGLAVSFINSVYWSFGTAIVTEKTGIALQNRGCNFSLRRGHPNAIAPAKRPMHTIIPGMALRRGEPEIVFGVMGGHYQPVGHATVLTNMLDFGMDAQAAVDSPRAFFETGGLTLETTMPAEVAAGLAEMGHRVSRAHEPLGGGQMVVIDRARGVLMGASDPRKDGFAAGY